MNSRDLNTSYANALVDEWVRAGVTHAVVAPGSRSAPLALALARDARIRVHVVLDERSAAFFALGIGKETAVPAALVCTSGTAAANFHPAVIEAHHANVPLLVCTADRPPELHGVGAPQTIAQRDLFGGALRWSDDPGPPEVDDDAGADARWRSLACRAVTATTAPRPGPVHLNLAFREPLVPTGEPLVSTPGRANGEPWTVSVNEPRLASETAERLAEAVRTMPRGVVLAGFGARVDDAVLAAFARVSGWPVLADPVSGTRAGTVVATYEALLRAGEWASAHIPDVVLRVGAPLTSKVANVWAESVPTMLVDEYDEWLDPPRAAVERLVSSPTMLLRVATNLLDGHRPPNEWADAWFRAERMARRAIDDALDRAGPDAFEGRVARDLAAGLPAGARLAVASSVPVRALEWCMAARDGVTVHANRGANGIDGFVSTMLGVAAAADAAPTVALLGDLCFLHDTNGLLATEPGVNAVFVVVDNRGGGIFSYLPPAELPEFEALFATPQPVDIGAVARAHGVDAERVTSAGNLEGVVKDALARGGVHVVVVDVDRQRSVEHHRAMFAAVAQVLGTT